MSVTWRIHMCSMTRSHVWRDSFVCVTWLIHRCDMTHSCVPHDSCMCVTRTWAQPTITHVWHDSFICVTWLIHVCDMTDSYVRHDSFTSATRLIHMCNITHAYVWHDCEHNCVLDIYTYRYTHACDVTHSCVRRDSFIRVTWLIHMCDVTHLYVRHDSIMCATWLMHMCDTTVSTALLSYLCVYIYVYICALSLSLSLSSSLAFSPLLCLSPAPFLALFYAHTTYYIKESEKRPLAISFLIWIRIYIYMYAYICINKDLYNIYIQTGEASISARFPAINIADLRTNKSSSFRALSTDFWTSASHALNLITRTPSSIAPIVRWRLS